MEEVRHDHGQRQTTALVLAGNIKNLLLAEVAQLALPEARGPLRQLRGVPDGVSVVRHDLGRVLTRSDPVVQARRGIRNPARGIVGELHATDRGVVPQEAVTTVGQVEGDVDLGVALNKVDHQAFVVQAPVLVLAQAVDALSLVGLELLVDLVQARALTVEHVGTGPPEVLALLGQQLSAVRAAQELQHDSRLAVARVQASTHGQIADDEADTSVLLLRGADRGQALRPLLQRADVTGRDLVLRGANTYRIRPPLFHTQHLVLVPNLKAVLDCCVLQHMKLLRS